VGEKPHSGRNQYELVCNSQLSYWKHQRQL